MKLELKHICLQYDKNLPILKEVNLSINQGEFIIIQGPSGSGKSSLLRVINHLQPHSFGEILMDGCPTNRSNIPLLRRQIGYLQQTPIMIPGSVLNNFQFPFRFHAGAGTRCPNEAELRQKMDELLLSNVDLNAEATTLSIGQKQRISLIRTTMLQPKMLLCDEPTSALDTESRELVEKRLITINHEKKISIVLVTHGPSNFGRTVRKYLLQDGRLKETLP